MLSTENNQLNGASSMKKRAIYYFIILTSLLLSHLSSAESCNSLNQVKWLLGKWQSQQEKLTITEQWQQVSSKSIEGEGKTFKQNKLVSSETLRLVEMSGEVFYLAKVQHNAVPIGFKLVTCSITHAIFENVQHDFPKRISYQLLDNNELNVSVSDGKNKEFVLNFNKTNSFE